MSAQFDLALEGIRPEPLGSYLKALAVLRLVSEHKEGDPRAAGYWRDDAFHLVSNLDQAGLLRFFAAKYAPTPVIGPWGARSGFFPGSAESSARQALEAIVQDPAPRLAAFREVILSVRRLLVRKGITAKAKDEDKIELLADLRNELPDAALPWLDAAYVLGTRDERGMLSRAFPPILGTGGNEGSQGYASTFMQALIDAGVVGGDAREPASALFALPEAEIAGQATGQFMPGLLGGFNQGHGFVGGATATSPWEIILLFEGAATWVSGPSVRQRARAVGRESSPFTVRQRSVSGSAAWNEEESARDELWAPLWERSARWVEIAALLAEGRMQIGKRRASDTLEMARAATSLGVDRGIAEFVRYPILKRNGRSYFALAIGRFRADERPESELVGSLERPLGRLDRAIRSDKNTPSRLLAARRSVSVAMFEVLHGGGEASSGETRAIELLRAVGRLDKAVALWSGGREIEPLTGLSPRWLDHIGSDEIQIAAAIASIRKRHGVDPFRSNLVGVDAEEPNRKWATGAGQRAWRGATLPERLANVLRRRLLDASKEKREGNPLDGVMTVSADRIALFIEDDSKDGATEELIHAMTWIDWGSRETDEVVKDLRREQKKTEHRLLPRVYALLKLCFWAGTICLDPTKRDERTRVVPEPALVPLLLTGRLAEACRLAQRRLRAHRLEGVLDLASSLDEKTSKAQPLFCVRLAGSLLIPVSSPDTLIRAVTLPRKEEENDR